MASLNRVFLIGNLTKDPEVKYRPDGTAVADLRVAVSETFRNKQTGEAVKKTCFVDVVVWEKTAENCGKFLSKGSSVLVEGGLQLDEWQGKDGTKHSRLRERAQRVNFMGAPRGHGQEDAEHKAVPEQGADDGGRRQESAPAGGDGAPDSGAAVPDEDNLPF
jgi:single-strand DNA-binding protein